MSPLNTNHTVFESDVASNEVVSSDTLPEKIMYGMEELMRLRHAVKQPPKMHETPQMRMVARINLMPTFAASCMPSRAPAPPMSMPSSSRSASSSSSASTSSSHSFQGRRHYSGGGGGHDYNYNANKNSRGMYCTTMYTSLGRACVCACNAYLLILTQLFSFSFRSVVCCSIHLPRMM